MDRLRGQRVIAAAGLVLGLVGFALADLIRRLVEPGGAGAARMVDAVDRHQSAWLAAGVVSAASPFLMVPALVALVLLVRGRGSRLTAVGCALSAVGALSSAVHAAGYFGMWALYASAGVNVQAVEAMESASERSAFFLVFIALFMLGMTLGWLLVAIGLRRARLVPVWATVAALVFVGAGATSGVAAGVVGLVAALALALALARVVVDRSSGVPGLQVPTIALPEARC